MAERDVPPALELRRLIDGYQVSQGISVAAELGVADQLADGARTSDEVAEAIGADPSALYRLLRALATVDVLRELDGRRFELTPMGQLLRADVDGSLAAWATWIGRPAYRAAWGALGYSVRTGDTAFEHVHGTDVWTYRSTRPEESAAFDRGMASLSGQAGTDQMRGYDFSRFDLVADIGGGTGAFLARVLATTPGARGVLFDQPHVVAGAPELLARAGVADRCEVVGGSFFDGVPLGADAYVLRAVLHDWDDDDSVRILERVRQAISDDGTLLVLERVVAGPNEGRPAKWSDLNMLVATGGRERTQAEFDELLRRAGFEPTETFSAGLHSFVEGRPAT